jgi:crotonobetainyl-CoA:carnitine CoA-transferase CaiB-like acyl-CoA transferase
MSALSGYRVLELAESPGGEYCGKLLADFGADVIKLEKPGGGSPTRAMGPFPADAGGTECSGLFAFLNTNKHSVALDLAQDGGVLAKLLERVDVVIDDHAPGWLQSIGLDPAQLHGTRQRLVLCSITAFGQSVAEDLTHAEDLTVFHSSGWGYHTPTAADDDLPPLKGPGRFLASYEAALDAALCIVAALYEREESGKGQFIDIAKQQVLASRVDYVLGQMVAGDMDVSTRRTAFDLFGPAGIFACREGYAYIWMSAPAHWEGLGRLLGHPEWMREFPEHWLERACTPERVAKVRSEIAKWLKTQDKNQVAADAQKLGLTLVPVNNARDLHASPQYRHREYFAQVQHPVLGTLSYPGVPYKFSVTPAKIRTAAPLLGQHTAEQLAALDKSHD